MGEVFIVHSLHISGNERLTTAELPETMNKILGGSLRISYQDEPFEGRYRLTPYAYREGIGRRMVGSTYVDLGVGLLEAIREADRGADTIRDWRPRAPTCTEPMSKVAEREIRPAQLFEVCSLTIHINILVTIQVPCGVAR